MVIRMAALHMRGAEFTPEVNPYSERFNPRSPAEHTERQLQKVIDQLNTAGEIGADLVCAGEDIKGEYLFLECYDQPRIFGQLVEEIPGKTSARIAEVARKHKMNVVVTYYERERDEVYNTSVLIDREGTIAGKYRKVHLAPGEAWRIAPGDGFPVFTTDVGRIGMAICYDIIFPETCRCLALGGADIICHPTAGWGFPDAELGEALVRIRAHENSVYMIVSVNCSSDERVKSCVIRNDGHILCELPGRECGVASAVVTADFDRNYDPDYFDTFYTDVVSIRARFALQRKPSLYSVLTAEKPPLLDSYPGIEVVDRSKPDRVKSLAELRRKHMLGQLQGRRLHW
jgi:predicted amidohydrolase